MLLLVTIVELQLDTFNLISDGVISLVNRTIPPPILDTDHRRSPPSLELPRTMIPYGSHVFGGDTTGQLHTLGGPIMQEARRSSPPGIWDYDLGD